MYKVLVVDDERIIREGIASIIEWEKHGFLFAGAAQNGVEAYEMILHDLPQIVITDLKMPGMDGLELIAKVKEEFPEISFAILSGYGEFDLAKEAMRLGVRHYLLKPCNENQIIEVLEEISQEISHRADRELFNKENRENLAKVMPLVKEQFIRDLVTNRRNIGGDFEYYCGLLNIEDQPLRLVLFQPEGDYGFEELFGLIKILDEICNEQLIFNTTVKNQVLAIVQAVNDQTLTGLIQKVQNAFSFYHALEVTVAYSDTGDFQNTPLIYKEMQECLKYSSYLGAGSMITKSDIEKSRQRVDPDDVIFDYDQAISNQLAQINHDHIVKIHSKLVRTMVQYIQDHLEAEDLSLKWLSNNVIYMNDGYLSKLFIKETGEKFSQYLIRVRMEKAKELISKSDDDRVYEVAQKVGFGNNPQYFSQLFKKYSGLSPTEYKKGDNK